MRVNLVEFMVVNVEVLVQLRNRTILLQRDYVRISRITEVGKVSPNLFAFDFKHVVHFTNFLIYNTS